MIGSPRLSKLVEKNNLADSMASSCCCSRSARQIPVSASCREPSTRSESEELSRSEQLHLGCRLHLQTASAALLAPLAALAPQALLPLIASAAEGYADEASSMPSQDDPVITVIFTLAVIALLVLTAGVSAPTHTPREGQRRATDMAAPAGHLSTGGEDRQGGRERGGDWEGDGVG